MATTQKNLHHEELKPTPGKWCVLEERYVVSEHSVLIADCYADTSMILGIPSEESYRANARLIAAAPSLLKQLKALVVQIEDSGYLLVPPGVKAAIAKAEGR